MGMKCWKSAFNAQGSRLIIVVLQVGIVMEVLRKERHGETQFTTKLEVPPPLNVDLFYFLNILK
jgi:hypothetical protein